MKNLIGIVSLMTVGFVALLITLPARVVVDLMNGIFLGVVGSVMVAFFPLIVRFLDSKTFDRVSQLTVGIVTLWVVVIVGRVMSVIINATGPEMREKLLPYIACLAYVGVVAGVLQLSATGTVDGQWRYNRGLVAAAVAFGVTVACVAIYVQRVGLPWGN